MPSQSTPKKLHDKVIFTRDAILAAMKNDGLNQTQAIHHVAEQQSISPGTAKTRFYRTKAEVFVHHGNMILSAESESALLGILEAASSDGAPWSKSTLINFVNNTWFGGEERVGEDWIRSFASRHENEIILDTTKPLDADRVRNIQIADVYKFADEFEALERSYTWNSDFIFNVDESPADALRGSSPFAFHAKRAARAGYSQAPRDPLRTIVPFVSAAGRVWLVLYIFKGGVDGAARNPRTSYVFSEDNYYFRGTWKRLYACTSNGYMTRELWRSVIRSFIDIIKNEVSSTQGILIGDHLSSHLDAESIQLLQEINMHSVFFVPHTTHISQPLDQNPLAAYKKAVARHKVVATTARILYNQPLVGILKDVVVEAEKEAFTPSIIRASFRNTGVWPWDRKVFVGRVEKTLGITRSFDISSPLQHIRDHSRSAYKELTAEHSAPSDRAGITFDSANKCYTGKALLDFTARKLQQKDARAQAMAEAKNTKKEERTNKKHNVETEKAELREGREKRKQERDERAAVK
jgi:hypothetical protein